MGLLPESSLQSTDETIDIPSSFSDIPSEVKASKGGVQNILISWNSVPKAVKYYIYAASTPFEKFLNIGESTGTEFSYKVNSGVTGYFKVSSENKYGNESEQSLIVQGASLAQPFITSIESVENDNESRTTISWYMDNSDLYLDGLKFVVSVFNGTALVDSVTLDSTYTDENGVTHQTGDYSFTKLARNTSYNFQVEAYMINAQDAVESSGLIDAVTAAKQTPDAITELKVTEGNAKDGITISFKLPEMVSIKEKNPNTAVNSYKDYPVYFKIYKRLHNETADSEDAPWTIYVNHLYFDGKTESPSEDALTSYFDSYEAGKICSWTDTNVKRGVRYDYKIQSYVDNFNKVISSNKAVAECTGWLISEPSFKWTDFVYSFNDDHSVKTGATHKISASWNNFGKEADFKYIIQTSWTELLPLDSTQTPRTSNAFKAYNSLDEVNNESFSYSPESNDNGYVSDFGKCGYYSYSFYIIPAETDLSNPESAVASAIESVNYKAKIFITSDIKEPSFEGIAAISGYKNKVILQWTLESNEYTYEFIKTKPSGETETIILTPEMYFTGNLGELYSFEDTSVESGVSYEYELSVSTAFAKYPYNKGTLEASTLGIPEVNFNAQSLDYNKITIKWNKIPNAQNYAVLFGDKEINANLDDSMADAEGVITYVLDSSALDGYYNDASKSGLPVKTKVRAISDVDFSENETDTFTLGPAGTNVRATTKNENSFIVSWDAVPGANAYAVIRSRCLMNKTPESTDIYKIKTAKPLGIDDEISVSGNETKILSSWVKAESTETSVTLTDFVVSLNPDKTTPSVWEQNQDKLGWGFPYTYTIIPLKSSEDYYDADTGFNDFNYINLNSITATTSVSGYGMNVTATKSESPDTIKITWDKPYLNPEKNNIRNMPVLWVREHDTSNWKQAKSSDNQTILKPIPDSKGEYSSFIFTPQNEDRLKAFDFAVSYTDNNSVPLALYLSEISSIPDPLVTDEYIESKPNAKKESLNKGYLFSVNLEASNIPNSDNTPGYGERFEWTIWDYSKRSLGPDTDIYSLYLFNNDFCTSPNDWKKICEIDKNGNVTPEDISSFGISMTSTTKNIEIKPVKKFTKDGKEYDWYEGLLKVLRDYRHSAKLEVSRTVTKESETKVINASYGKDIYGWRNITDTEFARAALLNMAYGFFMKNGGDTDYAGCTSGEIYIDGGKTNNGIYSGEFNQNGGSYQGGGLYIGKYHHKQSASFYCPQMKTVSGDSVSFLYITNAEQKLWTKGAGEGFFAYDNQFQIEITAPENNSNTFNSCYSGSIKLNITCPEVQKTIAFIHTTVLGDRHFSVEVTRKNETRTAIPEKISDDYIHFFFPIQLDNNRTWYLNNQDYGWW